MVLQDERSMEPTQHDAGDATVTPAAHKSPPNVESEPIIYWHRELPPVRADVLGEHVLEASSKRVPGTISHRDDLWRECYDDLMARARVRVEQEVARLHGHYAHIFDEVIEMRRDEASGEAWLRGRFSYVLYRDPSRND
jgi:hypothetical protein